VLAAEQYNTIEVGLVFLSTSLQQCKILLKDKFGGKVHLPCQQEARKNKTKRYVNNVSQH